MRSICSVGMLMVFIVGPSLNVQGFILGRHRSSSHRRAHQQDGASQVSHVKNTKALKDHIDRTSNVAILKLHKLINHWGNFGAFKEQTNEISNPPRINTVLILVMMLPLKTLAYYLKLLRRSSMVLFSVVLLLGAVSFILPKQMKVDIMDTAWRTYHEAAMKFQTIRTSSNVILKMISEQFVTACDAILYKFSTQTTPNILSHQPNVTITSTAVDHTPQEQAQQAIGTVSRNPEEAQYRRIKESLSGSPSPDIDATSKDKAVVVAALTAGVFSAAVAGPFAALPAAIASSSFMKRKSGDERAVVRMFGVGMIDSFKILQQQSTNQTKFSFPLDLSDAVLEISDSMVSKVLGVPPGARENFAHVFLNDLMDSQVTAPEVRGDITEGVEDTPSTPWTPSHENAATDFPPTIIDEDKHNYAAEPEFTRQESGTGHKEFDEESTAKSLGGTDMLSAAAEAAGGGGSLSGSSAMGMGMGVDGSDMQRRRGTRQGQAQGQDLWSGGNTSPSGDRSNRPPLPLPLPLLVTQLTPQPNITNPDSAFQ